MAANENAFIYARMAESWARIRNEYGDTAYTAKDVMAEHAVSMGGNKGGIPTNYRGTKETKSEYPKVARAIKELKPVQLRTIFRSNEDSDCNAKNRDDTVKNINESVQTQKDNISRSSRC